MKDSMEVGSRESRRGETRGPQVGNSLEVVFSKGAQRNWWQLEGDAGPREVVVVVVDGSSVADLCVGGNDQWIEGDAGHSGSVTSGAQ